MSIRTKNMQAAIKGFDPFQLKEPIALSDVEAEIGSWLVWQETVALEQAS